MMKLVAVQFYLYCGQPKVEGETCQRGIGSAHLQCVFEGFSILCFDFIFVCEKIDIDGVESGLLV